MIEVKNLTKKYDGNLAVDHLDFTLEKGNIYGFLGPNGAGKSTTMNMLTGYLAPTEGTILINGHDILEDPEEARRCMGYLPELPPLYVDMTVWEYLNFCAELKKIPRKQRDDAIDDAMELAGVTEVEDRLIRNLSKGFRQRVGLAMAVLGFPDIIILDEPMVGLDPIQIIEMRSVIRNLAKDHLVLLSSHILSEVSEICDHIMIISKGKLVASATPEELSSGLQEDTQLLLSVLDKKDHLPTVMNTLQEETNIKNIELTKADGRFIAKAVISYDSKTEIRDDLFRLLCEAELPIYHLEVNTRSLEDIFIELTQEAAEHDLTAETKKEGKKR